MPCVSIPPGRDRHSCVLVTLFGYLPWRVHFGFGCLFVAISTGTGERGWRRGTCALLRNRIGIVSFSAGSTLGLRAPDCAKESSTLWTLFRGWSSERVRFTRRFAAGSRLSFFLCQEKRDGLRYLAFLFRRVEIAIRAFS